MVQMGVMQVKPQLIVLHIPPILHPQIKVHPVIRVVVAVVEVEVAVVDLDDHHSWVLEAIMVAAEAKEAVEVPVELAVTEVMEVDLHSVYMFIILLAWLLQIL